MDYTTAKECLTFLAGTGFSEIGRKPIDMAIEALDGMIPKKGKTYVDLGNKMHECPVCEKRIPGNVYTQCYYRFCPYCGQRVDWSGDND